MLQQLRENILMVEGQAGKIIANAKKTALEIAYRAEREILERRASFLNALQEDFNKKLATAKNNATKAIATSKETAKTETEIITKTATKNSSAAVKLIIDNILK